MAVAEGRLNSEVVTAVYTKGEIKPTVAPKVTVITGEYPWTKVVSLSCETPKSSIYFTTDGSDPDINDEQWYHDPFAVQENTIIKALVYQHTSGLSNNVEERVSFDRTAAPVISPVSGMYKKGETVNVIMTSETPEALIYYTTDGSIPTTASNLYSGPIEVTGRTNIWAIACLEPYWDIGHYVDDTTGLYDSIKVTTPVITPESGTYGSNIDVSISCAEEGVVIYYTTDGTYPNPECKVYDGPFTVSGNATVKAAAYKEGVYSDIATSEYIVANRAPIAVIGGSRTIEASRLNEGYALIDLNGCYDPDGDEIVFDLMVNGIKYSPWDGILEVWLPIGTNIVELSVSDGIATGTAIAEINVVDTTPPEFDEIIYGWTVLNITLVTK